MGIVSILLGAILLILFVGVGFYMNNMLGSLFLMVPNFFGNISPALVIVGVFAIIGLIIFLNFLMSGLALIKADRLQKQVSKLQSRISKLSSKSGQR